MKIAGLIIISVFSVIAKKARDHAETMRDFKEEK